MKCPFTEDVHYIGKSTQGLLRPMQHISNSHSQKIREWVEDISIMGYAPIIGILESNIDSSQLNDKEKYWIAKYIKNGAILLNENCIKYPMITSVLNYKKDLKNSVINDVSNASRLVRKKHKLNQDEMAKKSGVGLRWLRKMEGRNNSVNLKLLEGYLAFLGVKLVIEKI